MKLFAQIQKVDEEKRLVYGRAADETPDKSGEILNYDGSKPHFQKWSSDMSKDTDGKSLGNVRAMHGKIAVGKLTDIQFDDATRSIDVCAKVVDDNEWSKVMEGVYTGFSIGGAYGDKSVEKIDGKEFTRYIAIPNEISLVDRPCIPTAKFFQVQKVDGSTAEVAFKEAAEDIGAGSGDMQKVDDGVVDGTPEQVDELTKLMADKGLSLGKVIELLKAETEDEGDEPPEGTSAEDWAKMTPEEKAATLKKKPAEKIEKLTPSQLRKGMYECSQFAQLIASLQDLKTSAAYESYREGDNSPVPQALDACIKMCAGVLKQMIDEEVAEAGDAAGVPPTVMALAEQCGELAKREGEDPLLTLVKYGARNSGSDKSRIESIHKAAVELGAECAPAAKVDDAAELQKVEAVSKLIADAVSPLQKALLEATEKITKLEAQPMPAKVSLRAVAVSKAEDNGNGMAAPTEDDLVKDAHGAVHPAASLIKQAIAQGGAPMVFHG